MNLLGVSKSGKKIFKRLRVTMTQKVNKVNYLWIIDGQTSRWSID